MNEQKGKKILLPRSKDRAEQQNFPEQVSQKRGIVEIDETATDIENMVGFLQYKKESIFNKCFKINEKLLEIEEIVDVLTDIGINPAIARFRGEKYTEGSDFKIMKVIPIVNQRTQRIKNIFNNRTVVVKQTFWS